MARPGREWHACQRGIRYRVATVGWEKGGRAWLLEPVVAATAPAGVVLVLILVVARRARIWARGVLELGPRVNRNGELRGHLATLGLVWPLPRSLLLPRGLLMAWAACAWVAWGGRARRVSVGVIIPSMCGRRGLAVAVLRLLRVVEDEIAQPVLEGALSGLVVGCHSDGAELVESGVCLVLWPRQKTQQNLRLASFFEATASEVCIRMPSVLCSEGLDEWTMDPRKRLEMRELASKQKNSKN